MATYTKAELSGSTSGRGIKVTKTATKGDVVHTAVAGTTDFDEIWLWAQNNHTAAVAVTVEFGGVTNPDDQIIVTVPSKVGLWPLVPGLVLDGAVDVSVFAGTANVIVIFGFVNKVAA